MWKVVGLALVAASLVVTPVSFAKEKPIRWVPIPYKQFNVEDLVGSLTSCAYRVCQPGKGDAFEVDGRMRFAISRSKDDAVSVQTFVNKEKLDALSEEFVRSGFEEAIQECYSRLTE
jgi:hypothetical protein